jgi:tetratricopeptide (TPR) repeat protein
MTISKNKQIILIYLLLTAGALIAFWQVGQCDFVLYDDATYVFENTNIQSGITPQAIRWAITTGYAANWHPMTWLSHMFDVQLFGLQPRWHHLTNLLFHIANTLLLFFVFNRMTKAPWKSAFVAALFALHPLHVESVAWVAERKDVLSTFFWMLTMCAYVHYVEHPRLRSYLAALAFLALGLMAKPMLVTLPFVLLLLDYWPLQRFEQNRSSQEISAEIRNPVSAKKRKGKSSRKHIPGSSPPDQVRGRLGQTPRGVELEKKPAGDKYRWAVIGPLLWEKIPFFALAALSSIATFIAQKKGGAVETIEALPPGIRIANAFVSYIVYIEKTVWPANLTVHYAHPGLPPLWQVLGAVFVLIAATLTVIRTAKRFPYLAMGWLWYAGTLVPVIGIVQVGTQAMADRYAYIPLIGLFVMAAWGIPELLEKRRYRKEALFASSASVLLCLCIVTWTQVGYWRNSLALFSHVLEVDSNDYLIQQDRGLAYAKLGNHSQAIEDYDRAIEINPKYMEAYLNRGAAYGKLGDNRRAISDYDRAIKINPKCALAYLNRGVAVNELGNHTQAIEDYDRAIEFDPENADAYDNRGAAYAKLGNYSQAISDYNRAIGINPKHAWAYNGRGAAYARLGNKRQATEDYGRAIEINPEYAEAYYNRGILHQGLGNHRQAIEDYNRAIESNSEYAAAYTNRGVAYGILGNNRQAISDYDKAVEIDPKYEKAYYNRGVAYGELGNQSQAVSDYDKAIEINSEYADAYNNRGVAYAKLGNRAQAIEDLKTAARLGNGDAKKSLRNMGINW